jgi:Cof subfamily protein (haloacid dehalogenase superfamily)
MTARPWSSIPAGGPDLRLVACDMDGTLLTGDGAVPDAFWPLLEELGRRGITFVPASGRQYATLSGQFGQARPGVSYIAENGALVVHDGQVLSTTCLDAPTVRRVIDTTRRAAGTADLGVVVCGLDSAYIERCDPAFIAEAQKYYARLAIVEDLSTVIDEFLKVAIFDFAEAERTATTTFEPFTSSHQVVVSGQHWIDIMAPGVHKGHGVCSLQDSLGVTPAQTAVFGDYLNDLGMLGTAQWSFAMANAHPAVRDHARYLAPANHQHGVVSVLTHLLS